MTKPAANDKFLFWLMVVLVFVVGVILGTLLVGGIR